MSWRWVLWQSMQARLWSPKAATSSSVVSWSGLTPHSSSVSEAASDSSSSPPHGSSMPRSFMSFMSAIHRSRLKAISYSFPTGCGGPASG